MALYITASRASPHYRRRLMRCTKHRRRLIANVRLCALHFTAAGDYSLDKELLRYFEEKILGRPVAAELASQPTAPRQTLSSMLRAAAAGSPQPAAPRPALSGMRSSTFSGTSASPRVPLQRSSRSFGRDAPHDADAGPFTVRVPRMGYSETGPELSPLSPAAASARQSAADLRASDPGPPPAAPPARTLSRLGAGAQARGPAPPTGRASERPGAATWARDGGEAGAPLPKRAASMMVGKAALPTTTFSFAGGGGGGGDAQTPPPPSAGGGRRAV